MDLTVFASGSTGNCALVSHGTTHLLVDAGISAKNIRLALAHWGLTTAQLAGVVITHNHSDHISGLQTLTRQDPSLPLFASAPVARQVCYRLPVEGQTHTFTPGDEFSIGGLHIRSIPTSHDTPGSVGYRFTAPDGRCACIVTDLGVVTDAVREGVAGVKLAMLEFNHDPELLWRGPYPPSLKMRVAGPQGHLSNREGAELAALAAETGAHTLVMAHLSRQNNTPRLALDAARQTLAGREVKITAAPVLDWSLRLEV